METPVGAKIKQNQKITQLFVVRNIDGSRGAINKHEQTMPRKAKRGPPARQPEQSSQVQETNIQVPSDQVRPEAIAISEERLDDINGFIETKDGSDRHAAQCVNRLHEGLAECRESLECCVCLERPIRFVISPCGHCVCGHEKCGSANLQECPLCRGPITQMTKTFGPACAISDALNTCQKLTDQISVSHAEASSLQGPFMALALQWRIRFDQVSGLKREIADFQREAEKLSNDVCELAATVLDKVGEIEDYKNQLTAMEEKKVSLRNMYAANLSAHKEELDRKNDRIEALLSWSRLLEEDLAEANETRERSRQEIEALSSESRLLKEDLAEANENLERFGHEIEALSSESRLLKEDLAEANENLERSGQEIEALSSESRLLKENLAAANENSERTSLSIAMLSFQLGEIEVNLAAANKNSEQSSQVHESRLLNAGCVAANENSERSSHTIKALLSELGQLKAKLTASTQEKEEWGLSTMHRTHWMLCKFDKFKKKHAWLKHANRFLAKQLQKSKARGDRGQATSCNDRATVEEEMGMRSSLTSSIHRDIDALFEMSAL